MRKHYLDAIRTLTVAAVVVYHVIYIYQGTGFDGPAGPLPGTHIQDALAYLLYPWFMLLLFIVSGMSARYALEQESPKAFLRKRTRKLLVPSTIGLFVFQWIQGIVSATLAGGILQLEPLPLPVRYLIFVLSGTGVLWYIQMLWVFSLLILPVRKLVGDRSFELPERLTWPALILIGLIAWGMAQILNTPVIPVYRFGIYGFGFLCGYFVFTQESVTDKLKEHAPLLLLVTALLGIIYLVLSFGKNVCEAPARDTIYAIAYAWAACLAFIGSAKRWADHELPALRLLKENSWGLYIFHYLPLSVTALLLKNSGLPTLVIYLLTLIAALAGGLLLGRIIARIPGLRWCVMGLKKRPADNRP